MKITWSVLVSSLFTVTALGAPQSTIDPVQAHYFAYVSGQAAKGDAVAEDCLGDLYGQGFGVSKDLGKSFYWHSAAADKGNEVGKSDVALDYAWGLGVPQDQKRAQAIVQPLLAKDSMWAETVMGLLYATGTGVTQDPKEVVRWYTKAAEGGNQFAQTQLALMYRLGTFVTPDPARSKMWLEKAAQEKSDCASDYLQIASSMVYAYIDPHSLEAKDEYGPLAIKYVYEDGRATDITLLQSSGNKQVDDAWINAIQEAKLPPWPDNYEMSDKSVGIWARGNFKSVDPKFYADIKAAINGATKFPKDVLLNGSKGNGSATVAFNYINGVASDEKVTHSSGDPSEDAAALAAVANAKYPPTPDKYWGINLPMSIIVKFAKVEPTSPATVVAPAASTQKQ